MATATRKKKRKTRGPQAKTICPLLALGKRVKGARNWTIVNGTTPLLFTIMQEHIDNGVPGDEENCIVALAFRAGFGDQYRYSVGAAIVKIIDDKNRVYARFATPSALSEQIKKWERPGRRGGVKVGTWKLKPGPQVLNPLPKSWLDAYSPGGAERRKKREEKKKRFTVKVSANGRVKIEKVVDATTPPRKRTRRAPTRIVGRGARIMS